jgi:hypothetical protein
MEVRGLLALLWVARGPVFFSFFGGQDFDPLGIYTGDNSNDEPVSTTMPPPASAAHRFFTLNANGKSPINRRPH